MMAPPAALIEAASDALAKVPPFIRTAQQKELAEFGDTKAKEWGATGISADFQIGYELGLQTARVVIETNPKVVQAGLETSIL